MCRIPFLRVAFVAAVVSAAQLAPEPAIGMTPVPSERLPVAPDRMVVDDFNNDGKLDVATASMCQVRVLLGRGDGRFDPSTVVGSVSPCASFTTAVDSGDVNDDGTADLVWANGSLVRVLLGKGNGNFDAPATYAAGPNPEVIGVGDLNGDSHDDVIAADRAGSDGRAYVLVANADGTLQAAVPYSRVDASSQAAITIGDFDGNGKPDVAFGSQYVGSPCAGCVDGVTVLPGNGDGTLGARSQTGLAVPYSLVPMDADGDPATDLLAATLSGYYLLGANGDGTFTATDLLNPGGTPVSADVGDFDQNGLLDVVGADWEENIPAFMSLPTGWSSVGLPLPVLKPATSLPERSFRVLTGDFNGDGWLDVLVANNTGPSGTGTLGTVLNTPSGAVSDAGVDFGSTVVGVSSDGRQVTVRNTGVRPLAIRGVAIGGETPADFSVVSDGCGGISVPENGSCTITLSFVPHAAGTTHASLSIATEDPQGPYGVTLQGTGSVPAAAKGPADTMPPELSLRLQRTSLQHALTHGIAVTLRCSEACTAALKVAVIRQHRRPLKAGHREVTVDAAKRRTVSVRLNATARSALAHRRSAKLAVVGTAMDAAGNAARTVRRTETVRAAKRRRLR